MLNIGHYHNSWYITYTDSGLGSVIPNWIYHDSDLWGLTTES